MMKKLSDKSKQKVTETNASYQIVVKYSRKHGKTWTVSRRVWKQIGVYDSQTAAMNALPTTGKAYLVDLVVAKGLLNYTAQLKPLTRATTTRTGVENNS